MDVINFNHGLNFGPAFLCSLLKVNKLLDTPSQVGAVVVQRFYVLHKNQYRNNLGECILKMIISFAHNLIAISIDKMLGSVLVSVSNSDIGLLPVLYMMVMS